jgi:hypothetical protein
MGSLREKKEKKKVGLVRHPQLINMKPQFKLVSTLLWQVQISSNQQTSLNSKCSHKVLKIEPTQFMVNTTC